MKLHRVEVENLNSLYGRHAIDLDRDLPGASLFLIYGATGSGKSTLMDAVSLALFGQTPRLDARRGEEDAAPFNVMSHDTGACLAEIEFSKLERDQSRRRYRARWTCRRAHGRAEGKAQEPERSLERLEDDGAWTLIVSSRKRKDFDPAFEAVLEGFGVEDFKRSMLLAQGQFDALLDAAPEARATILERLTDTSVYKEIGQRVARLHAAHRQRLRALEQRVQGAEPVPPELIEQHEQRVEAAAAGLKAARELGEGLKRAIEAHAAVEAAERDTASLLAQLEATAEALEGSAEAMKATELAHAAASEAAAEARARLDQLRPKVEARQAAGVKLDEARKEVARRGEAVAEQEKRREAAGKSLAQARGEVAKATTELNGARATLEARPTHAELAAGWTDLNAALRAQIDAEEAWIERRATQTRARELLAETRAQHSADVAALEQRRAELLAPLRTAVSAAQAPIDAARGDREAEAHAAWLRDQAREGAEALARAEARVAALATAHEARRAARDARRALAQIDEHLAAIDAALPGATETARAAAARRLELARAHERLLRVASLADHRSALEAGEACPLCGSTHHPLLEGHGPGGQRTDDPTEVQIEAPVEAPAEPLGPTQAEAQAEVQVEARIRRELAGSEEARDDAASAERDAVAELETLRRERSGLEARRTPLVEAHLAAQSQLATAIEGLRTHPEFAAALAPDPQGEGQARLDPPLPERSAHETTRDDLRRAQQRAQRDADTFDDLLRALRRANKALEDAEATLRDEANALALAGERIAARAEGLDEADADLTQRSRELDEVRAELRARLAPFDLPLTADDEAAGSVAALHEMARSAVEAYTTAARAVAAAQTQLDTRKTELERSEAALGAATQSANTAREELETAKQSATECAAALERAEAELRAAWGPRGPLPEDPLKALGEADRAAQLARDTAGTKLNESTVADAKLRERQRHQREALAKAGAALDAARAALVDPALATAAGGPVDALERLRDRATEAAKATEAAQHEHTAASEALAVLRHRRDALRDHEVELGAAREGAAPYARLHELVGRNDGDAFKTFAQALNLARLIEHANHHLGRLSDRYRLAQVVSEGRPTLEFAVEDHYHLGRARSPRGLSGGERFLVSLALALGLSDLRTVTMPIETLLLDEGFGTLDPETLSIALGALQQLQSSGRQVGIISHVVGLREQIEAQIRVEKVGDGRSRVVVP